MSNALGQPIVVDDRGAVIGAEIVSEADPDGYTLLVDSSGVWFSPLLQSVPYNPVRDLSSISQLVATPLVLVVSPNLAVNSVAELVALAKAKPHTINYASGATGGSGHLAGELLKALAKVDIVRVAYKGSSLALPDLMSGQVHISVDNANTLMPLVKLGKLKALAVTSLKPTPLVPGLPTIAAAVPGYEFISSSANLFAPANTPATVINVLYREAARVLRSADVQEKLLTAGVEPVGSSPEDFSKFVKSEMAKWGQLIKDAGIKIN